jgi:succinate-acetate transporter protein
MANPMPFAFAIFGFALALYGARWITASPTTLSSSPLSEALNYAVLIGGSAQLLAGILGLIRGMAYPAYVTSTFGIWLIGFFFLTTQGATQKDFSPQDVSWFLLLLVIPTAIMAVPAFVHRDIPFIIAFVMILALLLLSGIGFLDVANAVTSAAASKSEPNLTVAVNLVKASSYCAFIGAAAIWWSLAKEVYVTTGVLRAKK